MARGARRRGLPRRAGRSCCATSSAARRRSTTPAAVGGRRPRRSTSSARTCSTPAPTRSTTRSARRCWPSAWASSGSSPRPAPASTASRPPRRARCSGSSASSTWAPRTCAARQPNVQRMGLLGATVAPVEAGARTLKDAMNEAIRDWVANVGGTHYVIGSCVGPAPFPAAGARPPARDRRRGARPDPRAAGRLPDARDRLRRRRLERDRHVRPVRRRRRRAS